MFFVFQCFQLSSVYFFNPAVSHHFLLPLGFLLLPFSILNIIRSRTRRSEMSHHQENQKKAFPHLSETPPVLPSPFHTFGLTSGCSSNYFHSEDATRCIFAISSCLSTCWPSKVQPVLLPCFLLCCSLETLLFVRPLNVLRSFLHPSSFYDKFPHHIAVLVCSRFVGLSSPQSLDCLQRDSSFQLLTLVHGCPSHPMDHPGLFQKYLLSHRAGRPPSCPPPLVPRPTKCHCGDLMPRSPPSHT